VQSHVVSRARFAPLSFGRKRCYTIPKSLASSSRFSLPEALDRGPGFGYRHVYAERECGVADGLDHDESHVHCADQTASALPFFLLALPAGSIGDIDDRRKLILRTELWMLGMAIVLAATTIDPHDDSVVSAFADGAFGD
jgi:hypothetical protein